MVEVIFVFDDKEDETIYVLHAMPLTTHRRGGRGRKRRYEMPMKPNSKMKNLTGHAIDAMTPVERQTIIVETSVPRPSAAAQGP